MNFWGFINRVSVQDDGCFLYTGPQAGAGYGVFSISKRVLVYAHRYSYEQFVGPIPDGLTIDHLCYNRRCVNPEHLEAVTLQENIKRAAARITHCPQGHEYNGANTRVDSTGGRHCRVCDRDRHRVAWNAKRERMQ